MNSVEMLTTPEDCQSVLSLMNKEKEDLNYKVLSLNRQLGSVEINSVEINAELTSINAELAVCETIIAAIPDGEAKDDQLLKKAKLNLRKMILQKRKGNYGIVSLVEREYDIAAADKAIEQIDVVINAVNVKLATLPV